MVQGANHEGHYSRAEDLGLLGVGEEYGGVIRENGLYELQTKGLREPREAEKFGPLVLCHETKVVEYLQYSQKLEATT